MIPIQLTIEGLYSYQQRQTIDFKNLTDAGLFGIFGAVGSGKSSILEAITFALYGETERLNSRDKRAYNMMNLKSNRSYIEFDFLNFENKKYRVTREFKRNSKNFEDVKPSNVVFYLWENESWVPQEIADPSKIIDLTYANFKRTIIIPQGQFKEFIELGAKDRTEMMKEIFNLHRYDLQNNVTNLTAKNKSKVDVLEGQLIGFEEINEEKIILEKENLQTAKNEFSEIEINFKQLETQYQQLKNLKSDFEILKQKQAAFKTLTERKPTIDDLENRTALFEKVFNNFHTSLLEKKKLEKELEKYEKEKFDQSKILEKLEKDLTLILESLKEITPKYEGLDLSKKKENDLALIAQMLAFKEEIKTLKTRTAAGLEKVHEVKSLQQNHQQKIAKHSEELALLKPQKMDSQLLVDVGNWFSENRKLNENHQNHIRSIEKIQEKIVEILSELSPYQIDVNRFEYDFQTKISDLEIQKKQLTEKANHLEVQQKLSHFAHDLQNGESCPLCGAVEHPDIANFEDVKTELLSIRNQISTVEIQQKDIQKNQTEIEKILSRKKTFEEQEKAEYVALNDLKTQLENHQVKFSWKDFNSNNEKAFENLRQKSFGIEKQIDKLNFIISDEQKLLEKETKNLEKFNSALEDLKLEEGKKEAQINTNLNNLKILKWTDYQHKTLDEIKKSLQELTDYNLKTAKDYQVLTAQEKDLTPKLASQKNTVLHLANRITAVKKEIDVNDNNLSDALLSQNFTQLKQVEDILAQNIDVSEARNSIQQFRIEFETLKNSIADYEAKLKDFKFDEEDYKAKELQFKNSEAELKFANDAVVKLSAEIERLEKEFSKKKNLLSELDQLQKRAANLKVMYNLFKGFGFVQYASSIYLRQLCDHANIRFHRMTRNQLSLQLNENNDFEIIDYLNEGRCRSVKTLSGGQAFQVSLSLALALAESVQSKSKSDKNFFFIDEGFGTQDVESVNIVFETLTGLLKENRIVGIISHVEELKEKMPISLNIIKDSERGSLISQL